MVVLEMVGEVIACPGGLVKGLDIHYVVLPQLRTPSPVKEGVK